MKKLIPGYISLLLMLGSCTASHSIDQAYKSSRSVATYSAMTNELQDGYLVLKENGYFKYYQKTWFLSIKHTEYIGHYSQKNDTLYLDWLRADPKKIKYYLSKKCITNASGNILWFVDEITNEKLWGLSLASKK